jgi:hypothetical protein
MSFARFKIILLALILHSAFCYGQQENYIKNSYTNTTFQQTDSGVQIIERQVANCRQKKVSSYFIPNEPVLVAPIVNRNETVDLPEKLLSVHGNITYYFNYRSYIDTPFAENDVMQHAVQTRLNVMVKEKYPFTVFINSRRSNSDYFTNATDVSFQFNKDQLLENLKKEIRESNDKLLFNKSLTLTPIQIYQREQAGVLKNIGDFKNFNTKEKISAVIKSKQEEMETTYKKLYEDYKTKINKLETLKAKASSIAEAQALIEEKENNLRREIKKPLDAVFHAKAESVVDSITKNAKDLLLLSSEKNELAETITEKINTSKKQFEKLEKEAQQSEQALKTYQKKIIDSLQKVKSLIAKIKDKNSLEEYLSKTGNSIKDISMLQRVLLSVKQIGIGRSWIDYSELTVKNISLAGFNIEMNPNKVYFAAAAGKVNYRFRDYIVKGNNAGSNQQVALMRAGFGKKDNNNVIFTYYEGQKALQAQTNAVDANTQKISGFSLETRKKIDDHNYLIAEYARSTTPTYKNKILDFSNNNNEAFSIKIFSDYGNTKANGYYRKTGEAFQSFTLFPTNNKQEAWMLRATQSVWKKRILLDAAIRKNDFVSPIAAPNFANSNVFKSFQVTARVPKYPFVSAGFYPSSQLALSNNNVLYENRYNTLNTIISHSYYVRKLSMNSNATFTKFYNSGSDSNFIYFNASTLTLNHSVNIQRFILQGILTITDQSELKQITVEPVMTYNLKNFLSVSASVKWNRVNKTETLWGGTAGMNLYINKIGTIQMQYDKVYLPSYSRNLLPVDMGRVVFSREF